MSEPSLWSFIINASAVVKLVILLLLAASIASWSIIIQRARLLKSTRRDIQQFEQLFWSNPDLKAVYQSIKDQARHYGSASIFYAGFTEFNRLRQQGADANAIMAGSERAMHIALTKHSDTLEQSLSFLATVGSTSPYVGLFGTVWGIMSAFRALGGAQQATIAMVAPGISEALIATAIGLFAAIPAVIAYNRFNNSLQQLQQGCETFQAELSNVFHRLLHRKPNVEDQHAHTTA